MAETNYHYMGNPEWFRLYYGVYYSIFHWRPVDNPLKAIVTERKWYYRDFRRNCCLDS